MTGDTHGPTFSSRLRARRRALGLSQAALVRRIGVSINQLEAYETGEATPSSMVIFKLSKELHAPLSFFFAGEGAPGAGTTPTGSTASRSRGGDGPSALESGQWSPRPANAASRSDRDDDMAEPGDAAGRDGEPAGTPSPMLRAALQALEPYMGLNGASTEARCEHLSAAELHALLQAYGELPDDIRALVQTMVNGLHRRYRSGDKP